MGTDAAIISGGARERALSPAKRSSRSLGGRVRRESEATCLHGFIRRNVRVAKGSHAARAILAPRLLPLHRRRRRPTHPVSRTDVFKWDRLSFILKELVKALLV
ncbi:hypothetical protein MRX96_055275 [Rhipicephalus microplus]